MSYDALFNSIDLVAAATSKLARWSDPTFHEDEMIDFNGVVTNSKASLVAYSGNVNLKKNRVSDYWSKRSGYTFWGSDGMASRSDVKQGSIGNCWLISAISACAEVPGTIEKNFGANAVKSFDNNVGFYDVQLNYMNCPITIRVDDVVPSYNSYTTTLFSGMVN